MDDEELEAWEGDEDGEEIETNANMVSSEFKTLIRNSAHPEIIFLFQPDQRQSYQKNGGWGVDEMFDANARLHGVQSTYAEDMSQYTTWVHCFLIINVFRVHYDATEENRAKADQIARQIEQSSRSSHYARLENDDDERDLDKITTEDELDPGNRKRGNKLVLIFSILPS